MLVLYHADCADGFCAAWVIHQVYPDANFVPVRYGQHMPAMCFNQEVVIVDFSYPHDVLVDLNGMVDKLIVLDHHKTAQKELEGLDFCTFDMDKSGAQLAWDWLHPGEPEPWLVRYTADRDLWKWELPSSKAINASLQSYQFNFEVWDKLAERPILNVMAEGEAILRYQEKVIQRHVARAQCIRMEGYKVLAVNTTTLHSEIGHRLCKGRPFAATYMNVAGKRHWSLRSEGDFDVSVIARKRGGGGHKNAAGFEERI